MCSTYRDSRQAVSARVTSITHCPLISLLSLWTILTCRSPQTLAIHAREKLNMYTGSGYLDVIMATTHRISIPSPLTLLSGWPLHPLQKEIQHS